MISKCQLLLVLSITLCIGQTAYPANEEQPVQESYWRPRIKLVANTIFWTGVGFAHGLLNNRLSKGEPNSVFWKAPLHEWGTGLLHVPKVLASLISTLIIFKFDLGVPCFPKLHAQHPDEEFTGLGIQSSWIGLSFGQMLGESIPYGTCSQWKIPQLNAFAIPAVWVWALRNNHGIF